MGNRGQQPLDQLSRTVQTTLNAPAGRFEVWVTGTALPRTRQELQQKGFTISERVGSRIVILD